MEQRNSVSNMTKPLAVLEKYLPHGVLPMVTPLVSEYSVIIKVKGPRKTKFGDYRPLKNARWAHQVTINNDLNPYAFLVTLLHEIAHMYTFQQHRNKVRPHGTEWKEHYSNILQPFLAMDIFPADIRHALNRHTEDVTASSCSDHQLYAALKRYDKEPEDKTTVSLESLTHGEHFKWRNGVVYQKAEKLRKRYRCIEAKSKRIWFFHPMAEVERLDF